MLSFSGKSKIFLHQGFVDMRKGFEGLSALVEKTFEEEISSGAYFAFLNRKKDRLKVLYWDEDGLALWYKRLEKGFFPQKKGITLLNRKDFLMLLEGVTPQKINRRYRLS
jgi:transposase